MVAGGTVHLDEITPSEILDRAGIASQAAEIVFRGADQGNAGDPADPIRFERSLSVADATHPATILGTYDLGVAYRAADEINLAVEAFGEIQLQGLTSAQHQFIGPSVEWTRGRFWITAGVLIGLTAIAPSTPHYMPRIIWAVAL